MAGLTKAGSQTRGDANSLQSVSLAGPSTQEQQLRDSYAGLANDQLGQYRQLFDQYNQFAGRSSFALTPEEQAQLDKAYAGSEENLRRFGNIMGQDLAGTRGLNTSDTPVSEAVLRETLPAFAALQGQKMQTGFGLGLQNRNLQLAGLQGWQQAASGAPMAGLNLMNSMQQDRLASATHSNLQNTSQGMPWINRLLTVTEGMKNVGAAFGGGGGFSGGKGVMDNR